MQTAESAAAKRHPGPIKTHIQWNNEITGSEKQVPVCIFKDKDRVPD